MTTTNSADADTRQRYHSGLNKNGANAHQLRNVLSAVDALQLDVDPFPQCRRWFGRADDLYAELRRMQTEAATARAALAAALVDGDVTPSDAVTKAAELSHLNERPGAITGEPGRAIMIAAAELAVSRALTAAVGAEGEALGAMLVLRDRAAVIADEAAAIRGVPAKRLSTFGYTADQAPLWSELTALHRSWEGLARLADQVRRAVGNGPLDSWEKGAGGVINAGRDILDGFVRRPRTGWELPYVAPDHILARVAVEAQRRDDEHRRRLAELSVEDSFAEMDRAERARVPADAVPFF